MQHADCCTTNYRLYKWLYKNIQSVLQPSPSSSSLSSIRSNSSQIINSAPSSARGEYNTSAENQSGDEYRDWNVYYLILTNLIISVSAYMGV